MTNNRAYPDGKVRCAKRRQQEYLVKDFRKGDDVAKLVANGVKDVQAYQWDQAKDGYKEAK